MKAALEKFRLPPGKPSWRQQERNENRARWRLFFIPPIDTTKLRNCWFCHVKLPCKNGNGATYCAGHYPAVCS